MIWGLQWDATCKWLASSGFNITDSTSWGNYKYSTADGHGSKQNTGFSESWKANNIYDFAGNCDEFTQEAQDTFIRDIRGGDYNSSKTELGAMSRFKYVPPTLGRGRV